MIDQQFDDILKRKLNAMTDSSESDWSAFVQKLEEIEASDIQNEGSFDNAIKQKLAGMTAASAASDWSTFQHMLEEDQITDQMLDDKVSMEMNSMRAPYRQEHWELLHDNIEYQNSRNRNIVGYKIIELSLLFLFLLSANNFFKYLPSTFKVEKPKIYAAANETKSENELLAKNDQKTDIKLGVGDTGQNENIDKKQTLSAELISVNNTIIGEPNTQSLSSELSAINITEAKSGQVFVRTKPDVIYTNVADVQSVFAMNEIVANDEMPVEEQRAIEDEVAQLNLVTTDLDYTRNINYPLGNVLVKSDRTRTHSIAVYAGIDNNLVNSPFDNIYDEKRFRTYGIGYSAGVEYGIKRGNKNWSVGLGYSSRSYDPRLIDELTGDVLVNILQEQIHFDILSISSGLKLTFKETDNWSFDVGLGASANIVVHSDYGIEPVSFLRNGDIVKGRTTPPKKPLHDGVNEGGSLSENLYLTTDISLGLERKIGENTFFTLRPEYSVHSFTDGIGPNNDLINNLSLNLGLKYNL